MLSFVSLHAMVGSDFCELPDLCDNLINEASIRRAPVAIPPVSVVLFIDLEFYQNMISIFQFFSSPSLPVLTVDKTPSTLRLIHFTPDMIRIYCCS